MHFPMVVNWQEKKECGHNTKEGADKDSVFFCGSFKIRWLTPPDYSATLCRSLDYMLLWLKRAKFTAISERASVVFDVY